MCGIAGIFNIKNQSKELRDKALRMHKKSGIADRAGGGSL